MQCEIQIRIYEEFSVSYLTRTDYQCIVVDHRCFNFLFILLQYWSS
jgi:hypothetical protein